MHFVTKVQWQPLSRVFFEAYTVFVGKH